jgi:hypothetical protein
MIVAIKALTRAFSAVARSANTHPRVVMLAPVAIAVSIIVIAVLGAYSLLIQPSMPIPRRRSRKPSLARS